MYTYLCHCHGLREKKNSEKVERGKEEGTKERG